MPLDPFCMKRNLELMRERRKIRRQMKLASWTMLFFGVCLVTIANMLIKDSTHQHLLKSLWVIGWTLNCFGVGLQLKLWMDDLNDTR